MCSIYFLEETSESKSCVSQSTQTIECNTVSATTLELAILVQSRLIDELQDEKKQKEKLSAQLEELKIQLAEAKMSNVKHSGNF